MIKRKILSALTTAMVAATVFAIPVSAATTTKSSSGRSFSSSWEAAASDSDWTMNYGFNTALINEDYTHTIHYSKHHTATVSNANGSFSDEDKAGNWAGIEVTHSGSSVYYSISY